jgi:hypothetical protein
MSDYTKMGFEKEVCSRCGGTGHYSWCQAYGSKCFKCLGTGYALSKRGTAGMNYYIESLHKDLSDIKIGDYIRFSVGSKWSLFEGVEDDELNPGRITIKTHRSTLGTYPGTKIMSVVNDDEMTEKQIEAIRYQTRLTKSGKEAKNILK